MPMPDGHIPPFALGAPFAPGAAKGANGRAHGNRARGEARLALALVVTQATYPCTRAKPGPSTAKRCKRGCELRSKVG